MVAAGHALCLPGNHENKLVRALGGRKVTVSHGLEQHARPARRRGGRGPRSQAARSPSSATGWSPTSSSTTGVSSSPTPGSRRPTTAGRRGGSAASRCTATRPARPTSTGCPCATPGPRTTAAGRWCSTATRRCPSPPGSTTPCASTPAASSAVGSPRCATPRRSSSRCPPSASGTSPSSRLGAPRQRAARPDQLDVERRPRQARGRDRAPRPRHHPRGQRRRRARGDEPLRAAPALLPYLPPTMAPGRHLAPRPTCSSIPTRRSRRTPSGRHLARVRGEAHGLARRGAGAPRVTATASRVSSTRAPAARSSGARRPPRCSPTSARRSPAPACGASSSTDWLLLDCELLPWSAKAEGLLKDQYAATGAAARSSLPPAVAGLRGGRRRVASTSATCSTARATGWPTRRRSPRSTAATAGRPTASTACCSRRSRCWRPRAAPGPTATTSGTSRSPTGWSRRHPERFRTTRRLRVDDHGPGVDARPASRGGRSSPRAAARAWSSSRWPTSPAPPRGSSSPA